MKYFTDDFSDIEGYLKQLERMENRFSNDTYKFLSTDSFHDAHIMSIKLNNLFNPELGGQVDNPTSIEAQLLHSNGGQYVVKWHGVNRYLMDFDICRNTYPDSDDIAFNGQRGIDDWIADEITAYDENSLVHKIILASDAKLEIRFRTIDIKKTCSNLF